MGSLSKTSVRQLCLGHPLLSSLMSRGVRGRCTLDAARNLQAHGIGSILTQLGENLTTAAEADAVTRHYLRVIDRVKELGQDVEISVKPTQLGLDQSAQQCVQNLEKLAS